VSEPLESRWIDLVRRQVALEEKHKAECEIMRQRQRDELVALLVRHEQERALAASRHDAARLALWRSAGHVDSGAGG
jgi:hypothetical protein